MTTNMQNQPFTQEAVVSEFNRLHEMITKLNSDNDVICMQLQAAQMSKSPPPLKLARPARYNGDPTTLRTFLLHIENIFCVEDKRFKTDDDKIAFFTSFLEGPAAAWSGAVFNTNATKSYAIFVHAFKDSFGNREIISNAITALIQLRQGTLPINEYASKFCILAADTDWNESALVTQFIRGLNRQLQDGIAIRGETPDTLADAISITVKMGNMLQSFHSNTPSNSSSNHSNQGDPMDIGSVGSGGQCQGGGRLTPAERKHRLDNNLCLYCGKPGHLVKDCRHKKARPTRPINSVTGDDDNKENTDSSYAISCPHTQTNILNTPPSSSNSTLIDSGAYLSVMNSDFAAKTTYHLSQIQISSIFNQLMGAQ